MHKIILPFECGCFKKSPLKNNQEFSNKDEAKDEAEKMIKTMNTSFCGNHNFEVEEKGQDFIINANAS